MLEVQQVPSCKSNWLWILSSADHEGVYLVDPGSAAGVAQWLRDHGQKIRALLITHSHWDHVDGIDDLVADSDLWLTTEQKPVIGPKEIRQVNQPVAEGSPLSLWDSLPTDILHTPGHLPEHLVFLVRDGEQQHLFCGDVLFSLGCGRIFRGTAEELRQSLDKLARLPEHTQVWCAHEYTEANIEFTRAVVPDTAGLDEYEQKVKAKRAAGEPSLPSTIATEKRLNSFLRYREKSVRTAVENRVGQSELPDADVFRELRRWKDEF